MSGVNKVIVLGNVGGDPEIRAFPDGTPVANFSVATSESWKDKQTGEKKEKTEWHNVVFTNRLAEVVRDYCKKGSKVYVEGSLHTRKWKDKEGKEKYTTEIKGQVLQLLSSRDAPSTQQQQQPKQDGFDDDIPF